MTTEGPLDKIIAKCRELLALAEKRTPGIWGRRKNWNDDLEEHDVFPLEQKCEPPFSAVSICCADDCRDESAVNAAFIAACAGNAEAGWKSTLAVIDYVLEIMEVLGQNPEHPLHVREQEVAEAIALKIIAAYPIELLE